MVPYALIQPMTLSDKQGDVTYLHQRFQDHEKAHVGIKIAK